METYLTFDRKILHVPVNEWFISIFIWSNIIIPDFARSIFHEKDNTDPIIVGGSKFFMGGLH